MFLMPTFRPIRFILVAGAVGLVSWCTVAYLRFYTDVSLAWAANGLLVGILVVVATDSWPELVLAAFLGGCLARAAHGEPAVQTIGLTLANIIECLIVAGAIRYRFADVSNPTQLKKLSRVAVVSTLVACFVSAVLAVAIIQHDRGRVWENLLQWYLAHVVGMVVIATLTLVAGIEGRRLVGSPGNRLAFLLELSGVAIVTGAVFAQHRYPLLFVVPVAQLWLTFREGWRGVVLGTLTLSIVAGVFTAMGSGPLYSGALSDAERVVLFQFFIGAVCIVAWPVAIGRAHRAHLTQELRQREAQYRLLAGNLRDLIVHQRADGTRLFVSESARDILGYEPTELMSAGCEYVHPDDESIVKDALGRAFQSEALEKVTFRVLHKEGHYIWLEALAHRMNANSSGLPEIVYSARDVTDRVRAEQAQAEGRRLMQAIADSVPAVIAYFDRNAVCGFANKGAGELFGADPSVLIGSTLREGAGENVYRIIEQDVIDVLCGERRTHERIANIHGTPRHYEFTLIPDIVSDGSVVGFFAMGYDITERKRTEQVLKQMARRDVLTGLANRREFDERAQDAVSAQRKSRMPLALMLIDVDHFKTINDTYGHKAGDMVLSVVAKRLQSCVFDIDLVARLGGDEFAILIDQNAATESVQKVAARAVAAMQRPISVDGKALQVTLSIGFALTTNARSVEALKECADKALYEAKAAGRNTYRAHAGSGSSAQPRNSISRRYKRSG